MAYNPIEFSAISDVGTNSYVLTTPSGALWNGINFLGAGEQNDFAYVGCNLQTDEAGSLTFEFSQDGSNWSKYPVTAFTIAAGINEVHTAWKGGRYVRPVYSGSDGSKTYFRLQTYYSNHPLPLSAPLNQSINADQDATIVRAVTTGQDNAGNFRNSTVDEHGDLKVHIHEPTTAFGELMTADMDPQIQLTFPYNINTTLVTPITSSTNATVTQANQMAQLNTGATANTSASLQSVRTAKYRAGQGMDVRYTALFTTGSSVGTKQLAGVGNIVNGQPIDGYFFGMSGSSFGVWTYNNSVGTFISSSGFGTDKFNGSAGTDNPSGVNIKPEKGNVYQIKYQWLGYGAIKFAIEDPKEGFFSEAHLIQYANANVVPSTTNPTFPMTYLVDNGGNAESVVLKTASGAVFVGGKNKITGPTQSTGSVIAASSGDQLLFALEAVSEFPSGSNQISYVNSFLRNIAIANEGSNNTIVSLELRENITITSPKYKYIGDTTSAIRGVNGTYVAGSGRKLLKVQVPRGTAQTLDVSDYAYEIQPGGNIAFILGGDASTSTEVDVSWVEDF